MKKIIVPGFFVIILLALYLFSGWIIGPMLEFPLERVLTRLFGMKVEMDGLYAHPWPGHVRADRITFHNQPEFEDAPHLDVLGIQFDIRFVALLNKRVEITNAVLYQPVYFIDRIQEKNAGRTNLRTWITHIRAWKAERDQLRAHLPKDPRKWAVSIDPIKIFNGTFIYQDRSIEHSKKYYFQNIDGELENFHWPTSHPLTMGQRLHLEGLFGEIQPAPFWIEGRANFATKHVSFDLRGSIPEGDVTVHQPLFQDLPIEIAGGTYSLNVHHICLKGKLKSYNELTLKSLEAKVGPRTTDKIWGIPFKAGIDFIRNEEVIRLEIPIHGDIADPRFEYNRAFQNAFQQSLGEKIRGGLEVLRTSASLIASQAQAFAVAPVKVVEEIGKTKTDTAIPEG